MNSSEKNLKITSHVLLIAFILAIVYLASDILFPIILAFLFAVMIRPIDNFLQTKWNFPALLSISVTIFLVSCVMLGIVFFLVLQFSEFISDIPHIKEALSNHMIHFDQWLEQKAGFKLFKIEEKGAGVAIDDVPMEYVNTLSSGFMYMVIVPIYVFLLLLYRSLLLTFLLKLVPAKGVMELKTIVTDIKVIIRNYIAGLVIEVLVVSVMTSVGLWLVGAKYFIFLGILTGLLNLIPYIGIIVAFFISSIIALVNTDDYNIVLWILLVNGFVQFVDNNILMPRIVGSKVSINALASIIAVVVGEALAGIPGMFLAIPVVAILKVIFDKIPHLQPYGYLLGDDIPKQLNWQKLKILKKFEQIEKEKTPDEPKKEE